MTPEQCRELAEFHEHMEKWFASRASKEEGLVAAALLNNAMGHIESARYWREKANV